LLVGVLSLSLQFKPIEIIKFAQVANGLLLPAVAGLMLWIINQQALMGTYTNKKWQNSLALLILILVCLLGLKSVAGVFGML
jgi:Mn2+/Fe2+ NRAMP family transporter